MMKCEENIKKQKPPSMTKGKWRYRLTLKTAEKEFKTEVDLKAGICEKVREKKEDEIVKIERKKVKVVHAHSESKSCHFEERDKMDWEDVTETYSVFWKNEEIKRRCYPPDS